MKNLITEGYSPRVWSQDKPILIGCSSDMMSWAAKYAESERRTETKLSELPHLSEHPRLYPSRQTTPQVVFIFHHVIHSNVSHI